VSCNWGGTGCCEKILVVVGRVVGKGLGLKMGLCSDKYGPFVKRRVVGLWLRKKNQMYIETGNVGWMSWSGVSLQSSEGLGE
jgi:hypothetical protein